MKLLYAAARPAFPLFLGGAEVSMHEILKAFAISGATCRAVGLVTEGPTDLRSWAGPHRLELRGTGGVDLARPMQLDVVSDVGYPVVNHLLADFQRRLPEHFDEVEPDIVFAQLDRAETVLLHAQRRGARAFHFLRDANNPHNFTPYTCAALAPGSFTTICSSYYLEAEAKRKLGIRAEVLHPPIDCDRFARVADARTTERSQVVMVNPVESKGGRILRHLIERLPSQGFTLVEGWCPLSRREWQQPNVTLVARQHNLERVLETAALLLVPSQFPEAFGRVVPEAQAAGVPVLASRHSGLIESHGCDEGMVADYASGEAWLREVDDLLHNRARRESLRQAGRAHCRRFDSARAAAMIRELVLQ
jgi:glycosyltransferase involved in cell wall biosynthesis